MTMQEAVRERGTAVGNAMAQDWMSRCGLFARRISPRPGGEVNLFDAVRVLLPVNRRPGENVDVVKLGEVHESSPSLVITYNASEMADAPLLTFVSEQCPRVLVTGFNIPAQSEFICTPAAGNVFAGLFDTEFVRVANRPDAIPHPDKSSHEVSAIPWLAERARMPRRGLQVAFGRRAELSTDEEQVRAVLDGSERINEAAQPRERPGFAPLR